MLLNKSAISAVFVTLKTIFNKAFEAAPSIWEKTTMKVPSTGAQNDYGWLGRFPKMRKWIGDKVYRKLKAHSYTVVNDDWEATVAVDRNDIEDDNLGIYNPMAQDAGFSAKQLPDEIDADLKNNAFTEECYDGQYFYDTDHPVTNDKGVESSVSNKERRLCLLRPLPWPKHLMVQPGPLSCPLRIMKAVPWVLYRTPLKSGLPWRQLPDFFVKATSLRMKRQIRSRNS